MKVFLAQMNPVLGDTKKNLMSMIEIIKKAISEKNDIVVFPELSLTGYLLENLVYDVAIGEVPKELLEYSKDISIIFGAVELGSDFYHYNTVFYLEDEKLVHKHRKVYLPTYGLFDEGRYFKAGDRVQAFDTKFGRIGMLICEYAFHPSLSYILGVDGAHTIFVVVNSPTRLSNDGLEIENIWTSICQTTAVTNTCFVIMVNRVGFEDGVNFWGGSLVASPGGKIIKKMHLFESTNDMVSIDKDEIRKIRFGSSSCKNEKIDLILNELKRIKKI